MSVNSKNQTKLVSDLEVGVAYPIRKFKVFDDDYGTKILAKLDDDDRSIVKIPPRFIKEVLADWSLFDEFKRDNRFLRYNGMVDGSKFSYADMEFLCEEPSSEMQASKMPSTKRSASANNDNNKDDGEPPCKKCKCCTSIRRQLL